MPVKLIAAVLLAAGLICSAGATIGQQTPKPGSAAPDFRLVDLAGREFRSSQLKGSIVVLDLWATWCEPCIADIPMFNRLHEKYAGSKVKVVGIAVQSGWAKDIQPHVARNGVKYLVLVGNEKITEQYVAVGFPLTYLIGHDGKVVKKYIGTLPDSEIGKEMDLEREIDRLLQAR
jgi:thiol-disulfide isomerase/thioredoxin